MKEELRRYVHRIQPIDPVLLDEFMEHWHPYSAPKKEVITEVNSVERHIYFVCEGCQKAYFISDGNEHIIAFSHPYAFTCIPESFLTQKPSNYSWQCISDSQFLRISYDSFFRFVNQYPVFERLLWKKLIGTVGGLVERYHRLVALSMEERFKDLMKKSPQLINHIPQKDLANYLKIDPSNFSRLINRLRV